MEPMSTRRAQGAPLTRVYGAYGDAPPGSDGARSGYTGEVAEADIEGYVFGRRLYDTVLRRFVSPDLFSPFGDGGLNRYAYCGGDPIGRVDPTGYTWASVVRRSLTAPESPPASSPRPSTSAGDSSPGSPTSTDASPVTRHATNAAWGNLEPAEVDVASKASRPSNVHAGAPFGRLAEPAGTPADPKPPKSWNSLFGDGVPSGGRSVHGDQRPPSSLNHAPRHGSPSRFVEYDEYRRMSHRGTVDPKRIRFSQNSVSYSFYDKASGKILGNVDTLADELNRGVVSPNDVPEIRLAARSVAVEDGMQLQVYTLDNRRLAAFQQASRLRDSPILMRYRKQTFESSGTARHQWGNEEFKYTTECHGTHIVIKGGPTP